MKATTSTTCSSLCSLVTERVQRLVWVGRPQATNKKSSSSSNNSNNHKCNDKDIFIDAVFFAQTHVLQPSAPFFKLVGHKDALIKVHVLSKTADTVAPLVQAELVLPLSNHQDDDDNNNNNDDKDDDNNKTKSTSTRITLQGPSILPQHICLEPGKVVHRFEDSFTAVISKEWIQRGLQVTIHLVEEKDRIGQHNENMHFEPYPVTPSPDVGPPLELNMTMFDIHYFGYEDVDYPTGWQDEIAVRRPLSAFRVQRLERILFDQLIIPPRAGLPAVRCSCTQDYQDKTGQPFNGKQAAALQWQQALQTAGGQYLVTAFYINIANVASGGESWDYGGMGTLRSLPILNHEMGHVLGVNDLPCEGGFPYKGPMYGRTKSNTGGFHGGPTWRYDPRVGFISPVLSQTAVRGIPGEWKKDPMGGGGINEEPDDVIAGFSDYSVRKMQEYMEGHVAVWDEKTQTYRKWEPYGGKFSIVVKNDGIKLPIERDVEVYSVMAAVSAVTEEANYLYKVLGPYRSGLIDTFDPNVEDDRIRARKLPLGRWDVSFQIVQGGVTKTFMLPIPWRPDEDNPISPGSLYTRAINVPVRNGKISHAKVLLTPEANVYGMPSQPTVLCSRDYNV